jgi:hypothetical protein
MTALVSLNSETGTVAREASSAVLEILDGLHQGVALALEKAVYRIGTSSETDLILGDPGVAEQHVVLRMAGDQVAVEAVGGEVDIVGPDGSAVALKQGHGQRMRLPLEIRIGNARLRLRDTRPPAPVKPTPVAALTSRHWAVIAAVLLMLICTLAFALRTEPVDPTRFSAAARPAAATPAAAPSVEQAHAWLDQSLRDAELAHLQTRAYGGQISVEGSYPISLKDRWVAIQQSFDSRFGQHVVLTPRVQATAVVAKPRVRFQAVWFGANPYVIDEHGKRLYPGATLQDNWVLESIEGDQVRLVRGHERFAFTL